MKFVVRNSVPKKFREKKEYEKKGNFAKKRNLKKKGNFAKKTKKKFEQRNHEK